MNPGIFGLGPGKSLAPSGQARVKSRPSAEELAVPTETLQLGVFPAFPTPETLPAPASPPPANDSREPRAPSEPPAPSRSNTSPTGLILHETEPDNQQGSSLTFADMARAASAAVGKTVKRWLLGDPLAELQKDVAHINELEAGAKLLRTPEQFAAKTASFQARLANGETLDDIRDEAYAVAREAALQASGMRAFDCQMLGALAMNHGHIAQMRTGEGKTLTAVMPLYLNALAGKGAHLITINEALAKRDSEWMGPIFERLGMKVGLVLDEQTPEQKRANYDCDITYLTDRALGFDYLHDQTALDPSQRVQRGHFFALVDEVDEVMLDEARTPMILSVKDKPASPDYRLFAEIVKGLVPGEDYQVDQPQTSVWLTDGGLRYVENEVALQEARKQLQLSRPDSPRALEAESRIDHCLAMRPLLRRESQARKAFEDEEAKKPNALARLVGIGGEYDSAKATRLEAEWKDAEKARQESAGAGGFDLYSERNFPRVHYLDACLKAQVLQVQGKHYCVENGEIKIIDQNKGRVSDGKRFSQGLHQALEAKEGLQVQNESRTAASITLPELFNTYQRKSGMTGTGKTSEAEFRHFYDLSVVEIPTNKPVVRKDQAEIVFATEQEKLDAVVDEAVKSAMSGRPVLVGTVSVNTNKAIAEKLLKAGFPSDRLQVLNAETARSGEDVYEDNAGMSGTITLATGERADRVVTDSLNFKMMARHCEQALEQGRGVVVDVDTPDEAEQMQAWASRLGPVSVVATSPSAAPAGEVVIRVGLKGSTAAGSAHLQADQYRVEKLILDVDPQHLETTLENALQAYQDGRPVLLRCKSSHGLSLAAERLLDGGLGLESLPLVCDGKEKENLLIERAGRAGFITVATNMAGRGADIKPDTFDYDRLAESAYQKSLESKTGLVIDFAKDSQARKLLRRLQGHCAVTLAETPEQRPAPGQILLRFGEQLPALESEVRKLEASQFETHGLYVIGTERSSSRRIDDQLIGRAGRQGAEGESRFFLSMQDDLLRLSFAHRLEGLVKAMGGGHGGGVSNPIVSQQIAEIQQLGESEGSASRCKSDKLEEVARTQRKAYFAFRDEIVASPGDRLTKDTIADFATSGLARLLSEQLGDKNRYSTTEISQAAGPLLGSLGIGADLQLSPTQSIDAEGLEALLSPAISRAIDSCQLASADWKAALLYTADQSWQDQLEDMETLRDAVQLEVVAGHKPEEVYALRGFSSYEAMVANLKTRVATELLPQLLRRGATRR